MVIKKIKMETGSIKNYTLVTGASAGTGMQLAIECAKKGHNLYLVSLPDSGLENFAHDLAQKYPVDIKYLSIDLTKTEAPQQVFDFSRENQIRVNILINNAGMGYNGKLENQDRALVDTMILLNIRATTLLTSLFIADMKMFEKAYILNLSSFAGLSPLPFKSVYSATKAYIFFMTQALNIELKGTSVSVTSVHPNGIKSERALENIKKSGLLGRVSALTPEQVAKISLSNMYAENHFVVPGVVNKFYYGLGMCLPHGIILKLIGGIFRKA
jgi:hypothetical protein